MPYTLPPFLRFLELLNSQSDRYFGTVVAISFVELTDLFTSELVTDRSGHPEKMKVGPFKNLISKQKAQLVGSLSAMFLGALVIFAWFTESQSLVELETGVAPVHFNSALSFLCLGMAFLFIEKTIFSRVVSTIVLIVCSLTLVSYFSGTNLGIDELFINRPIGSPKVFPSRMAANTAICFVLTAASLIFGAGSHRKISSVLCAIVAGTSAIFGLVAQLGYSQSYLGNYGWKEMISIALATSIGNLLLSGGICAYFWRDTRSRGEIIPVWSSFLIFALGTVFTLLSYQGAIYGEKESTREFTESAANHFRDLMETRIMLRGRVLERATEYLSSEVGVPVDFLYNDASERLDELPGFEAIGKTDENGNIVLIKKKSTITYTHISEIKEIAETVEKTGAKVSEGNPFHLSNTFTIGDDKPAFAMVVAAYRKKTTFDGVVFAIFDVSKLFNAIANKERVLPDFNFAVFDEGKFLYSRDGKTDIDVHDIVAYRSVEHGYQNWTLNVMPSNKMLSKNQSILARQVLAVGILVSLLLSIMVFLVRLTSLKSRDAMNLSNSLQAVLDGSTRVSIIATDLHGKITIFNSGAEKMLGYTSSDVVDRKSALDFHVPEELKNHSEEIFARAQKETTTFGALTEVARHGAYEERQWLYVRKDGSRLPVSLIITPIKEEGKIVGFLEIAIDVTESERRLHEFAKKLEKTNQELEEFSYVASHDLKEPVRNLISYSKLLEDDLGGDLPKDAADDLRFITDAARRMETLVNDLLHLSRAGRGAMKVIDIDLDQVIENVLEDMAVHITETGAQITHDKSDINLKADKTLLGQLFSNLISNAIKFVKKDATPIIQIKTSKNADKLTIEVIDNGIGMKNEYLAQIFLPFKRLHGMNQYEGTGIGLSICKRIIERHNGTIAVTSQLDVGSSFSITLPLT